MARAALADEGWHVRFSIRSSFEEAAELAERLSELCARRFGADDEALILRLCLAEALNNIVEHAYGGATGRPIEGRLRLGEAGYAVTLIDEGKPMPGGDLPEGRHPLDPGARDELPDGGFGWMLIKSQMDRIDYRREHGCNVLCLEKQVRRGGRT